ncbi:cysteine-rich receptor-like protein kinase 25 isoform X2 [Aegilops tauschii subsp. strangulata]|uniref:cysteine-rich receptor-like protein kinase 25 isoform X2 n=1 Tax=Aegilops tauschii subsp. strangulata TaxID=200361 RepID=UPI00098AB0AF|nr:cysteine-rich receptor-like protein kinase 25 isoform X2 [Aegilops tauschii subsp. strangulata]
MDRRSSVPVQGKATGDITLETLPKELTLDFLKKITNDFSTDYIKGSGAFGTIYKGILGDGEVIAVQRLEENSPVPREKIFTNESNGTNIIAEITETLLCYEYLPKGSLHQNLFGESSSIDWDTRFGIIKGICEGILFLHTLPNPILHLGLTPQNILLDNNMAPKISEFGFSRIFGAEKTRTNTQSDVGSIGYMAPEYLYNGEISARSDIYSLGLIIMEICTREKNSSSIDQKHARKYIDGVKDNWIRIDQIMSKYKDLEENCFEQIEGCIKIALQCVEIDGEKRPSIEEILNSLSKLPDS